MVATRSRSATDDAPSFADLTDDTLVCVFQMLRPDELGACLRTCKTWRRLICEGNMDEHWWDIGALECGMSGDEKMKFPRSDGRRVCDVVASRWIRRRDSREFLSACHADVLDSAGEDGADPVKVPLRLREWVKTRTVVDTKSELAQHDHADLADYYRDIMALPRVHVTENLMTRWLADLAVMQGERRAFATIKEALDDPDFDIPGHERCVELVERCAAAISGIIDPYLCSSERNWGAADDLFRDVRADPTTMHAEEKWLWVLRRDFRSFGSSLKAHPSDRPLFPEESVVEALDRMGAEFKRRLEEKNVDPKSEDPSVLREALTILTNFLCGEYPNDGANHVADMDFNEMPTNVHELNPHLLHPKFQMPKEHGLGLKGAESSVAVGYYDPMNSSLFCVLHNRVGIPITLSIVMAAVARRGGLKVEFINQPGHFRCGVVGKIPAIPDDSDDSGLEDGPEYHDVLISSDPFEGVDAVDHVRMTPYHGSVQSLVPSARDVVTRILNNLFIIYHRQGTGEGVDRATYPMNEDDPTSPEAYTALPPHRWLVRNAVIGLSMELMDPFPMSHFQSSLQMKRWLPMSMWELFLTPKELAPPPEEETAAQLRAQLLARFS